MKTHLHLIGTFVLLFLGPRFCQAQADASLQAAMTHFETGQFKQAELALKAYTQKHPNNPEGFFYLGRVYLQERKADQAIEALKKACELNNKHSECYHQLGEAYIAKLQQVSWIKKLPYSNRALSALQKSVALNPGNLDARVSLAEFYMNAPGIAGGSMKKAFAQAEVISKQNRQRGILLKADIYVKDERYKEAEAAYQEAVTLTPRDASVIFRLGLFYQVSAQYSKAFETFEKTLALNPEHKPTLYQLGKTCVLWKQNLDRGLETLGLYTQQPAPRNYISHASAYWRIGMLYELKGDPITARASYETALRLNPDHKPAKEALSKL